MFAILIQGTQQDNDAQDGLVSDMDESQSDLETIGYSTEGSESAEPHQSSDSSMEPLEEDETGTDKEKDRDVCRAPLRRQLFAPADAETAESHDAEETPGYSLVWDNVGKLVKKGQQTSTNKTVYAMFANTLMIENRISFNHMKNLEHVDIEATDLPLDVFLPRTEDWNMLKKRMGILVQRVLVTYVPSLEIQRNNVCWHIEHEFSDESASKSNIVSRIKPIYFITVAPSRHFSYSYFYQINIGVVKANPASAKGVVQIMKKLQDYVPLPNGPDGEPHVTLCHGDQLSCERMSDARFAMGTHEIPANRLKGLEPTIGEFHHRCLTLQVYI